MLGLKLNHISKRGHRCGISNLFLLLYVGVITYPFPKRDAVLRNLCWSPQGVILVYWCKQNKLYQVISK